MTCCICDPPTCWHVDPNHPAEATDLSSEVHKYTAVSLEAKAFAYNLEKTISNIQGLKYCGPSLVMGQVWLNLSFLGYSL